MFQIQPSIADRLHMLMQRRGQIATITTRRALKVRKNQPAIDKISTFQCRVGVDYDNIQSVQDKRRTGELPVMNAGLPWGQWVDFPYVIEHRGEYYFRCTRLRNNFRARTQYVREGQVIDREQAQQAALASEFREQDDNEVFTIKIASIQDIA